MVPVVDLARRGARYAAPFAEAAERVARSGRFLLGDELARLETELGATAGPAHVVAVSSGASGLQLALAGLGVGPGHEVIVPAFTAVPTASAVAATGATPVLADVDPVTAAATTESVARVRTTRTRAVILVHLYGRPAEPVLTDLPVIDDAAQAFGAVVPTSSSAAVVWSFYPTKNLGGIGDGGAVATADAVLAERIRLLRNHGMTELYRHDIVSQNFRMSEIEAAWLRLTRTDTDLDNRRRRSIAAAYRAAAPELRWSADHPAHVHHLVVFRHGERERVRAALADREVATAVHYPRSIGQQPAFASLGGRATPESDAWAAECITVPCFPEMTDDEVARVASALTQVSM